MLVYSIETELELRETVETASMDTKPTRVERIVGLGAAVQQLEALLSSNVQGVARRHLARR